MNAFFTGRWDGCNLWIEWDETGEMELQYATAEQGVGEPEWGEWKALGLATRGWGVRPIWREGERVRVRLRRVGDAGPWTLAREVVFQKARCRFAIEAAAPGQMRGRETRLVLEKGASFTGCVDGGVCTYVLPGPVQVPAGARAEVEMEAMSSGPWAHLDAPGDFVFEKADLGKVYNIEPSREGMTETGVDWSVMEHRKKDGPVMIAFGASLLELASKGVRQ